MKADKLIGYLLILGALGVFIPYTILTITFNYPDILREDSGAILTRFHEGGSQLIFTWLAFAFLGLPLLIAYILLGQKLAMASRHTRWITTIGIISGVAQIIGLLRWVFVVPILSSAYVNADTISSQETIKVVFITVHQFGGVLLGEHIGQLFTVVWTIGISFVLRKTEMIPKWIYGFGLAASLIYFLAQAELLATVIPTFPKIEMAGLIGSTMWLLWLIITGVHLGKLKNSWL
jgi:hypothetical protein